MTQKLDPKKGLQIQRDGTDEKGLPLYVLRLDGFHPETGEPVTAEGQITVFDLATLADNTKALALSAARRIMYDRVLGQLDGVTAPGLEDARVHDVREPVTVDSGREIAAPGNYI